jgi:hypothetical protein
LSGDDNLSAKARSTSKGINKNSAVKCLDADDNDDEGFIEGDIVTGKVLSTFKFWNEYSCCR